MTYSSHVIGKIKVLTIVTGKIILLMLSIMAISDEYVSVTTDDDDNKHNGNK